MCGISGIFSYANAEPVSEQLLQRMTRTLVHRGPDDEGFLVDNGSPRPAGLGHRRLSIIDLSTGRQPIFNEDRSVAVVFNGEIYNYIELREGLESRGHSFRTSSDTETIVHLYEEEGESCVRRLRGMFAFAVWDSANCRMLLARDRLGKKPLYYSDSGGALVFGSELKAVIEHPGVGREIDPHAAVDYFTCQFIPAPGTIFRSVRKLPAGHILIADPGGVRVRKYWDLDFGRQEERSEDEWCDLLIEELRRSVGLRLISDVPLGAFLSGGLDSTVVTAMMAWLSGGAVITATAGFGLAPYDETAQAREVASLLGTDHHECIVEPEAAGVIERLTHHFDEPFGDSSAIPQFLVSQAARRHVKVALSGDGGDENFAGYRRHLFDAAENRVRGVVPGFARRPLFAALASVYPKADWLPRPLRAKTTFQNLSLDPAEAYFNSVYGGMARHRGRLLSRDFTTSLQGYDPFEAFLAHYRNSGGSDPLDRALYADIKTYLADDILAKVDRASMAVSLEVRSPLLDHRFVELAASIPPRLKLKGGKGKHIFRKAAGRLLPAPLIERPKKGFVVPIREWLREELRQMARETIFDGALDDGMLDRLYLEKLWRGHQSGLSDHSRPLWAVLAFRLWQRRFSQKGPPEGGWSG